MQQQGGAPRGTPITGISAVLPAYNEEHGIVAAIEGMLEALRAAVESYEVIVVDDGSRDATGRLVDTCAARNPQVRVIHHSDNRGYGSAWRSGLAAATLQYIVFMDADAQFDSSDLPRFLVFGDHCDLVTGYCTGAQRHLVRSVSGRCLAALAQLLFGMRDWNEACGFVLARTALLQEMDLASTGSLINAEIHWQAQRRPAKLTRVPIGKGARYPEYPQHLQHPLRTAAEMIALRWHLGWPGRPWQR